MVNKGHCDVMGRVLTALLCLLSLMVFGLIAQNRRLSHAVALAALVDTGPELAYGDRVDPGKLRRALGQSGDGPDDAQTFYLLYFMRPSHFDHLRSIKYGEPLLTRHGASGLRVFCVTDAEPAEMKALAEKESLSLPVLFDRRSLLKMLLRVPEHYEQTYLITSAGEVVFSMKGAPQEDLMRQIVEKYVVGQIDYSRDHARRIYRVGEPLPKMRVAPLAGGPALDLAPHDAEVVIISARCTSCQLHAYIKRYRALTSSTAAGKKRFLVFSRRFSQQDLLTELTDAGVTIENVYVATEPLGDLENEYRTKTGDDEASVIVAVDGEGRVERLRSINGAE